MEVRGPGVPKHVNAEVSSCRACLERLEEFANGVAAQRLAVTVSEEWIGGLGGAEAVVHHVRVEGLECLAWDGDVVQPGVLASSPGSELSNDPFPQRARKRLLARDQAGLRDRLAYLADVGGAAGAAG